ncbi:FtsW/RodA/SpoVE family cell cycle protein [Lederbergia citrea]|uniref:Probable peptidoglycan glycosyltransferase FtsW n=1 Tax=Lederbergia citrea TaxID=2833581 RepID=A0A942UHD5_9BACI|nr:FtsW/RodA/SpoVE family cell cycle protein [Lederbergia citrea]MBS4203919.1 FtsW/RodA/SpoVE family cell cycle protein [Lederbergia citrea]MBS4221496.1 FtsW/RodA/SpoVE family cell cycle protein [Lederbergia citrea]
MFKKILKSYDYSIIAVYILLCLFGLVMIYSSSMVMAVQWYEYPADFFYQNQKLNLLAAFTVFLFFAVFPYKAFRNKKFLIVMTIISVLGLFAVSVLGHVTNNAQSWIQVGARKVQPSEFVKISVIIYLSAVYANKQRYIDQLNKGVFPPIIYLVFVCFLIKIEPDNGTAAITLLIGLMIIICSGMRLKTIIKLIMMGVLAASLLAPFVILKLDKFFTAGNMKRISGFLDPFGTAGNEGFQLVNSYLAIGSGGLKGLGLGQSIQKMGYLPEAHTDFIMAVIAEELGVFGVGFVVLGLGYIVLRGFYVGIRSRDPFGSMLAIGIAGMIGIQTFINLGGMSGLIPITGVPLPFISYGGSSIVVLSIAMGILTNVAMFRKYDEKFKTKKTTPEPKLESSPLNYRNETKFRNRSKLNI